MGHVDYLDSLIGAMYERYPNSCMHLRDIWQEWLGSGSQHMARKTKIRRLATKEAKRQRGGREQCSDKYIAIDATLPMIWIFLLASLSMLTVLHSYCSHRHPHIPANGYCSWLYYPYEYR